MVKTKLIKILSDIWCLSKIILSVNFSNYNVLELKVDKLILDTFIGELEGPIIHKDYDYKNCNLDNLKYELCINEDFKDRGILWINNKEFSLKQIFGKILSEKLNPKSDRMKYFQNKLKFETFEISKSI